MADAEGQANERTSLLVRTGGSIGGDSKAYSRQIITETVGETHIGETLPYNAYATIDWLHELAKETVRLHELWAQPGFTGRMLARFDAAEGWIIAAVSGILTALVAFAVDVAEALVNDWKLGYCSTSFLSSRTACCTSKVPGLEALIDERAMSYPGLGPSCAAWKPWSETYWAAFGTYGALALLFALISVDVTLTTKSQMPIPRPLITDSQDDADASGTGKTIYLAAGSGIPEIKTVLSGFVIPHLLGPRVLLVKAIGAVFATGSGLCLGKEGPFVHIATCAASIISRSFPKYRDNGRKLREMLSAGCAAGIAVAFGAPIGGVLFSYEEVSSFFPRKTLWRAFLCSLSAAVLLKHLNPTGDGKLALFETNYRISYSPSHYLVFAILGLAGGLFGGAFCKLNFLWSNWFRAFSIIKNHPALEIGLVIIVTSLLHYPNPITRESGTQVIKELLRDCREDANAWICRHEASSDKSGYIGWLVYGSLAKLVLTIITFGCKVPSGIIIPALDAGSFFGRLIGQAVPDISPGIFAMVGAASFLAGVSRMTISLGVVMFELTGELEYIVPNMLAILIAKWVADALEPSGVYDLAQNVLGHPFLDADHAVHLAQQSGESAAALIPPQQTMDEITVHVPNSGLVPKAVLSYKFELLKRRGLIDAGLALVQNGDLKGYVVENELDFGLRELASIDDDENVRLMGHPLSDSELDLSAFVNRCPITLPATAPIEYIAEFFTKLGLRYVCLVNEGSNELVGVVIKKRFIAWLENIHRPNHKLGKIQYDLLVA